jgi:hypothetical protein
MTGDNAYMWMTEWVRLREARKREIGLKRQAAEEANRPYKVRAQALTELLEDASPKAKANLNYVNYVPGTRQAWKIQATTVLEAMPLTVS